MVGWCQGTLLGLVSFCQPKDKDPEFGASRVVPPPHERGRISEGGGEGLRLLNPHIKLGLPSNKLEF